MSTEHQHKLGKERANKACTGRLGLCVFLGVVSELWQLPVSKPMSPQPPVTQTVRRIDQIQQQDMQYIMDATDFLGKEVTILIDRPLGTIHPEHQHIYYPINYGYIPNIRGKDQEELDAYLLGVFVPLKTFTGKCIAVIHRTNDQDDKLIVMPQDKIYSDDQIQALTEFQERFFTSVIIR